jgi:hypothetical protein
MAGVRVVGSRRRDAVALIGALVLVVVSVWIVRQIHTSDNPVNSATVYAAYLGVATLLVSLLAFLIPWWWKVRRASAVPTTLQVAGAADQFAQRMFDAWRQEATARRISTPAPVRVQWRWGPDEVASSLEEVRTAPVTGTGPRLLSGPHPDGLSPDPPGVLLDAGIVTQLHEELYCKLPHGRLVLLGGPGAGKTSAMILLLLAALKHRDTAPEAQRGEVPVPVWLTLGSWDPTTQTLHQWAAATMYRDHPYLRAPYYGPDAAGKLLRAGHVALFLDGLDEMAPSAQSTALARIDQEGAGLRLVLSSRPKEYQQAISRERVHNTAVIEVQPVDPETARDYLLHDQIGSQHDRWAQLGDYLTDHPDSTTAHALNNPLTLSLTRVTYQNQDPTSLTNPAKFATVAALREHLIDRTLITAYPDERQRAHATRWLAWIAHHLGSDRDLAWWHIPTWLPEGQLELASGLAGGLAGMLAGGLAGMLAGGLAGMLAGGLAGGFALGFTGLMSGAESEPRTIFPRWPDLGDPYWPYSGQLKLLLVVGLVVGLVFGLVSGLVGGLVGRLAGVWEVGFVVGFVVGFTDGVVLVLLDLWNVPLPRTATATPTAIYRIDRRTSIVTGLVVGLTVGLMGGLVGGLLVGLKGVFGLKGALVGELVLMLICLLGSFLAAVLGDLLGGGSMKVSLTELILATTGAGRVKFIRVLEDAHHRQLLRQSGAVYQFRHAELQDHLAEIHRRHTQSPTSDLPGGERSTGAA